MACCGFSCVVVFVFCQSRRIHKAPVPVVQYERCCRLDGSHLVWFKMWFTLWFYVSYFLDPLAFSSAALRGFARSEALGQGKTLWTLAPWYFSTDSSWAVSWRPASKKLARRLEYELIASGQQFMRGLVLAGSCSLRMASLLSSMTHFRVWWDLGTLDIHAMGHAGVMTQDPKRGFLAEVIWCNRRHWSLILANWLLLPNVIAEQICFTSHSCAA